NREDSDRAEGRLYVQRCPAVADDPGSWLLLPAGHADAAEGGPGRHPDAGGRLQQQLHAAGFAGDPGCALVEAATGTYAAGPRVELERRREAFDAGLAGLHVGADRRLQVADLQ